MSDERPLHIDLTADASLALALEAAKVQMGRRHNRAIVEAALHHLRTRTGEEAVRALVDGHIDLNPGNRRGSLRLPGRLRPLIDDVGAHLIGTNARRSATDGARIWWTSNRAIVIAALLLYGQELASRPTPSRARANNALRHHH